MKLFLKYKKQMLIPVLFLIINVLLTGFVTYYFATLINKFTNELYKIALKMFILYFIMQIGLYLSNILYVFLKNKMIENIEYDIKKNISNKALKTEILKNKTANHLNLLTKESKQLCNTYFSSIINVIMMTSRIMIFSIILFIFHYMIGLIVVISLIIRTFIGVKLNKKIYSSQKDMLKENEEFTKNYKTELSGTIYYKRYLKDTLMLEGLYKLNRNYEEKSYNYNKKNTFVDLMNLFVKSIENIVVIGIIIYLLRSEFIKIGVFLASLEFISLLSDNGISLVDSIKLISLNKVRVKEILEVIEKEIIEKSKIKIEKKIEMNNVNYSFGTVNVLKGINLLIEKGKKYAIVGKSGSGKTTLLNILCNLYNDYEGIIKVDRNDVKNKDYTDEIAYLTQNIYIFDDTLDNNITFGEECDISLLKAQCGLYNTPSDVSLLSGGEKQRIAIARVLYRKCKFIVVDETFSALDDNAIKDIKNILLKIDSLTYIEVNHRINSFNEFDHVYEVNKGLIKCLK